MNQSQNWVVTGGAGFLGSHVTEQLLRKGESVVVVDILPQENAVNLQHLLAEPRLRYVEMDIRAAASLSDLFCAVRPMAVVHLAALHFIPAAVADPARAVSLNVHGTQCVLSASRAAAVERFWFASTGDVYAPDAAAHSESSALGPFNIYGLTKLMCEQLIQLEARHRAEARFTVGRLFNLYGPRETNPHILPDILQLLRQDRTAPLRLGNLSPRRDMVPVDAAARAVIETAEKAEPGLSILNVATGVAHSMEEMLKTMERILGATLTVQVDPSKLRRVERDHLQADVTRLRSFLGWTPDADIDHGLTALLAYEGFLHEDRLQRTATGVA